ncbi:helix-turn-helix domain-containing protein [Psychromonas antarctica]|uniref:helix-turn-helix domain-containing protein n=1 Tax=Psychromonas antarctica TaxID=67573 RepID=UPI001EE796F8|nr:helix-turn-helix transcriptional regulator [Psychromonas antarctica]MCG6202882.1 helix-turn-helix transcriptional regulator [Psychromonas antarctica]
MIRCNLSKILGEKRIKVAELARETGVNKNTIHRLYNETATRIDIEVIEKLCCFLEVGIGELFEIISE